MAPEWRRARQNLAHYPNYRLLALGAVRAYDKNLPFCGAFRSSKGEVKVERLKCGRGG